MAVGRIEGRLGGGLILLRGCPLSGADAFAAAATQVLGRHHRVERQWVVDLDNPATTTLIAGQLASAPAGAPTLVKTHLSREALARRHPELLSQVCGEIRMFRPPLDVALASHGYLLTVPGTLAEGEHRFDAFLERWLAQEGNCSAFVTLEFAGWADLAREALQRPPDLGMDRRRRCFRGPGAGTCRRGVRCAGPSATRRRTRREGLRRRGRLGDRLRIAAEIAECRCLCAGSGRLRSPFRRSRESAHPAAPDRAINHLSHGLSRFVAEDLDRHALVQPGRIPRRDDPLSPRSRLSQPGVPDSRRRQHRPFLAHHRSLP